MLKLQNYFFLILNCFSVDVVENFEQLSKLIPPIPPPSEEEEKELERKKRLQQAKFIQSQKRNGLAGLFKILQKSRMS